MNMQETVSLYNWLAPKKEDLETEGSSATALSMDATAELGFKVTVGSVKKALKAAGINLKVKKNSSKVSDVIDLAVELARFGEFSDDFVEDLLNDPAVPPVVKKALQEEEPEEE